MFPTKELLDLFQLTKPLPNCLYTDEVRKQDLEFALAIDSNPNIIEPDHFFIRLLAHVPSYRKSQGQCIYWVAQVNTGEFLLLEGGYDHGWTIDSWLVVLGRYKSKSELIRAIPEEDDFGRLTGFSLKSQIESKIPYGSVKSPN